MIADRLAAVASAPGGGALPRVHQAAARASLMLRWTAARVFASPSTSVSGNNKAGPGGTPDVSQIVREAVESMIRAQRFVWEEGDVQFFKP